jgi:hypothetical protein
MGGTEPLEMVSSATTSSMNPARSRGAGAKKLGRPAAAKARGKVTEVMDDDDDTVIELD